MTSIEIISLIAACQMHKVLNFKLDGLEFSFGPNDPVALAPVVSGPVDPQVEKDNLEQLADEARQVHLDNLRLSDPLQYEQLISENQLEQQSEDLSA